MFLKLMASNGTVIVIIITTIILLFFTSLLATNGAIDTANSAFFNTSYQITSAYQYILIATILGWIAVITLTIITIIIMMSGSLSSGNILSESQRDPDIIYKSEQLLRRGRTINIITLIVFIIIAIITFGVIILAVAAAMQLIDANEHDTKSQAAYTNAIVTATLGSCALIAMLTIIFLFIMIQSEQEENLGALQILKK